MKVLPWLKKNQTDGEVQCPRCHSRRVQVLASSNNEGKTSYKAVCQDCRLRFSSSGHTVVITGTDITLPGTVDGVDLSAHAANASAHHTKTTDAGDITSGTFAEARIPAHMAKSKLAWTAEKLLKGAGAGADPTEIDVPTGATVAHKTADETVNNSTTLQNDDELYFAVAANEVWEFRAFIIHKSGTTPDIKFAWAVPTGATITGFDTDDIGVLGPDSPPLWGALNAERLINGGGGYFAYMVWGVVVNGANAGNVQLQWAQYTADASDTIVRANSFIIAHKLS